MIKKVGALLVSGAILFGCAVVPTFAAGNTKVVEDGRNGNGIASGTILSVYGAEGTFYVGDTLTLTAGDVIIDGDLSTLTWEGLGSFELTTPGTHTFTVTASTYFKNGKKAGEIHSTTSPYTVIIEVKEKQPQVITLKSYELSSYTYTTETNKNGKVTYNLTAIAKFVFSDGHEQYVTKEFKNVQDTQSIGFTVDYNDQSFEASFKAPAK